MKIETRCIHGNREDDFYTGSVSVPIYQTATFAHPGIGQSTGYDYSRLQNPTRHQLEVLMADLEHGADAMAFSTGMAAITTVMELFEPGDHLIVSDDLYGGSIRLFEHVCKKHGLTFDYVDTSDLKKVESLVKKETKGLFVETPTNPMMHVTDLAKAGKLAGKYDILFIVDNTFLSPFFQNPIDFGADIVLHSATKYLGGHNDTLAGIAVTRSKELAERLRFLYKTTGACLSPFDSFLIIRGIKTLAVRMERQEENAKKLSRWLSGHKLVQKVYYPGLDSHPQYEIMKQQSRGFGAMISFDVDSPDRVKRILGNLKLIQFAESLGGVETLLTYPMLQTHGDLPREEQLRKGIHERFLRLSVGLENYQDLQDDLEMALNH